MNFRYKRTGSSISSDSYEPTPIKSQDTTLPGYVFYHSHNNATNKKELAAKKRAANWLTHGNPYGIPYGWYALFLKLKAFPGKVLAHITHSEKDAEIRELKRAYSEIWQALHKVRQEQSKNKETK